VEGAIVLLTGTSVALLLGAGLSFLGASAAVIAVVEMTIGLGAGAFVLLRYGKVLGAIRSPAALARWVDRAIDEERALPKDRIALISAVELERDRGRFGESASLGDAAIASATTGALHLDTPRIVRDKTQRSLKARLVPFGGSFAVIAVLAILEPRHLLSAIAALTAIGTIDNPLSPLPPEPRLDDIKLTYRFPAYTERMQRIVQGGSGDIRALPGTEVVIETRARDDLQQATLLVANGAEGESAEAVQLAAEVDGRHIRATMVISRAGRYRFRLRTERGELMEERRGHDIELELDDPPEVTLLEPEESPLEVNERDRLNLVFDAKDDFGLGDIFFSWRVIGSTREGKEPLTSASRGMKRYPGSAQLELAQLKLRPGDRVAYTLEARDNDTVNGPKIGASATKELRIYSKTAHHEQVLSLQEQAVDELVHILGDNLEALFEMKAEAEPYKKQLDTSDAIVERAFAADQLLRKTIASVRKDPLGRRAVADAFESARAQLLTDGRGFRGTLVNARRAFVAKRTPDKDSSKSAQKSQGVMVTSLEKNVVYLADLLNDQRMIDAESLLKDLRAAEQELKKALEAYKNAPDDDKRKALSQAIREIKQRIKDIMQQLAKLKGSIPTDFVNPDALKTKDSESSMEDVQRLIEEGDLDGAMSELDRLLKETEDMMSQMQNGREELGSREYSEIQEQAERMWRDLTALEKEQRDLAKKTERMSKEVLDRMKSRLGDANSFVEKQKKRLQQAQQGLDRAKSGTHVIEGDLHDQAARRIEDGIKALEARDFGAAKEMVQEAAVDMEQLEQDASRRAEQARRFGDLFGGGGSAEKAERELRRTRPILEEVLRDIEKLMPPPDSLLSKEERAELDHQAERQQQLKDRADRLGEEMEKLGKELPIVGQGTRQMLGEAGSAMQQAGGSLGQGDAPSGLNQERRALDALSRLKQELEKRAGQSQSQGGGGVPLPFGQPEGNESGGQEREGDGRFNDQHVEIPKPEQYKAPAEFRQDILEAAKQGTVEDYKEAVRRYYEELVK
jgi:hypothetical protein